MSLEVRVAMPGDGAVLHTMVRELAGHHGHGEHFQSAPADFEAALFAPHAFMGALLAFWEGTAAGCAIWHRSYSTFRGREVMYLEDLSVLPQFRRRGIARALLKQVARTAVGKGYPAFAWLMMDWNEEAKALYTSVGAELESGITFCRMHGDALERLAK